MYITIEDTLVLHLGSFAISDFTDFTLPTHFHMAECNGTEENITSCQISSGDGGCQERNDASVICQGNLVFL